MFLVSVVCYFFILSCCVLDFILTLYLCVFFVSVVCYLFFLSCCVLNFILTLYLCVFLVSVVCYLFFLSCCVLNFITHQEHTEIQCKYEIQHTTWQDKQITNNTHQEHTEIQCKYEIQHTTWQDKQITNDTHQEHAEIQCKYEIQLSCHVVCWISYLHCISVYSWWVSFVICLSCHVVCWISYLHCISGEIQHTTWQDEQITNDTHQEHAEIQCKYEIQHTTWQDKQITNNTHQEHTEIQWLSGHPNRHTWQYCWSLWFSARSVRRISKSLQHITWTSKLFGQVSTKWTK
jgi:hypothetical protein